MKKFVAYILATALLIAIACAIHSNGMRNGADDMMAHVYPTCGIVESVNYGADYMVIRGFDGIFWVWEGVEDFQPKDVVAMIMDDNNTESVLDDHVMDVSYCGWIK